MPVQTLRVPIPMVLRLGVKEFTLQVVFRLRCNGQPRLNTHEQPAGQPHQKQTKPSCTSRSASAMGPRALVGGRSARAYDPGPGVRTLHTKPGTSRRPFLAHTHTVHVEPLVTAIAHQHGRTPAAAAAGTAW